MGEEREVRSRTQIKREMETRQALGERLIQLPDSRLEKLGLPGELLEAIRLARRLTRRGALRRQRQYIGVLMRSLEIEPIERALAETDHHHELGKHRFHKAERCRDRLIEGDSSCFEELITEYPLMDIQHLRSLVRNARKEAAAGKPPRSSRLVFRFLTDLFSSTEAPS